MMTSFLQSGRMKMMQKRSQFVVHELKDEKELSLCLKLDHTYATDYVWQIDMREESDDMIVRFRTVHLPRTMSVPYPRDSQSLATSWEKRDCFLVATAGDVVLGYANMRVDAIRTKGWIHDLVVGEPFRRRHIGSALLEQVTRWAQLHAVRYLTIDMQSKNDPGINFVRKYGFVFCGFHDHYYMNQDIALFFGKSV
jgi:ribosomal protein S18 acetylase RimI-like enzyme